MRDAIAAVFLLGGATLAVIAGIGLHRFADVFARMHVATKPATFGLALVIVGASIRMDDAGDMAKLLLVGILQFVTAPIGAHLVGRAAHLAGTELSPDTVLDELGDARSPRPGDGTTPTSTPPR